MTWPWYLRTSRCCVSFHSDKANYIVRASVQSGTQNQTTSHIKTSLYWTKRLSRAKRRVSPTETGSTEPIYRNCKLMIWQRVKVCAGYKCYRTDHWQRPAGEVKVDLELKAPHGCVIWQKWKTIPGRLKRTNHDIYNNKTPRESTSIKHTNISSV